MVSETAAGAMTIAKLLSLAEVAEKRLAAELQVCLWPDGSGCVMAPAIDHSADGKRTDLDCLEAVCECDNLDELVAWLRIGKLPEDQEETLP